MQQAFVSLPVHTAAELALSGSKLLSDVLTSLQELQWVAHSYQQTVIEGAWLAFTG
jgi:hypothetical protein